ncbi:uncharacterized protein UV8b_01331 [Ustilaginoidea virens]|uniref:Nuc-1 negative regulatory protein preg n=1 Tax=Ustilaginoidea virens TaxID=1159556 RepID=A0A8E5HKF0_USTVR|nr:uncharacterized protein UV8b_01331 [Ustilaginoidea virens]QUC17090.1 hypothetical protein UV8b_01331 [Ustilaginoidea virens]
MLETSPVLAGSANGSPSSFRNTHAASRSAPQLSECHHQPSAASSAAAASATSAAASAKAAKAAEAAEATHPRASPSAASTDTACNTPQRPHRAKPHNASTNAARQHGVAATRLNTSGTSPSPRPHHVSTQRPPVASPSTNGTSPTQPPSTTSPHGEAHKVLSPNKRRVCSGERNDPLTRRGGEARGMPTSPPASTAPKRPRKDQEPPKILPQQYELCAVEDVVELIAHMLAELIATNDAIRISSGGLTRFHSRTAPGISVQDYLHRLARHATLTPPLLLAMVYYIDRLCALYPEFTINTLTVHRFLITAATVAAKGLSDSFWNNTTYARVGGVRVAELKLLELEFLYRVDWKIVPNPEVLVAYYRGLVERTSQYALEPEGSSDETLEDDGDEVADDADDDDILQQQKH